jgi:hypothetical protein
MTSRYALVLGILVMGSAGCANDNDPGNPYPVDAGKGGSPADATPDVASDGGPRDAFFDLFDAFPLPDGFGGACLDCIRDKCSNAINQCANNDACRTGLACALTTCIGGGEGGAIDFTCAQSCFNGDPAAAIIAFSAFNCFATTCGPACAPGG